MTRHRQHGFSLLELLVAMTILAVLGTIGFTQLRKHSAEARYIKAKDNLQLVGKGLDQYYLKHGFYPELNSFQAMVEPGSALVKENLLPANATATDPWGQPFEGTSSKGTYSLKCLGAPGNDEFPPIVLEAGKLMESGQGQGATPPAGAPPAPGGAPQ